MKASNVDVLHIVKKCIETGNDYLRLCQDAVLLLTLDRSY